MTQTPNHNKMEEGKWYRIVFQVEGVHRKPRETVQQYLGWNPTLDEYILNLRPLAGTQGLRPEHIIRVEPATRPEPMLPRIVDHA